jgi:hypothetical protein
MKLIELEPRWWCFEAGGPRVGLTFLCPHCKEQRLGIVFKHRGHEAIDENYIRVHGCKKHVWTAEGDDFHNLTLTPSVDASKIGHWHGFITNGNIQ